MEGVLVTGAAGFLGSAVCRAAVAENVPVVGLVRAGELAEPVEGVVYRKIDWSASETIETALAESVPGRIVHCAGATPRVHLNTAKLYEANVALVWRLLEAVQVAAPDAGVAVVSTAGVYGPTPVVPTTEGEPLNPVTHYAWSKVLAEQTARAFAGVEGLRVSIARPFNLIGAGEPKGSVVSDVIEQLRAGASVIRVRETSSVRDFVDVDDAARALLLLAELGEPGEAYNVCSGVGTSVGELLEALLEVAGAVVTLDVTSEGFEGTVSVGSPARVGALGWETAVSIRTSLDRSWGGVPLC